MRRSMFFLASAAAVIAAGAGAGSTHAQTTDCPIPGYVFAPGPGQDADRNGDGFVCVDPLTGDVKDNPSGLGLAPGTQNQDRNGNGWVCVDVNNYHVVTDDTGQPSGIPGGPNGCPDDMDAVLAF